MTEPFDFLILGADGQQGIIIAKYLLKYHNRSVVLCDMEFERAKEELKLYSFKSENRIVFEETEVLSGELFLNLLDKYKPTVVINSSSFYSSDLADACLTKEINWVDLFACPFWFDELSAFDTDFKIKNKSAITGCGSVPGIGNVMAKKVMDSMESVNSGHGGFAWDSNIKTFVTPFCLPDVIRELSLPVWVYSNKEFVTIPAQSHSLDITFPLIGKQKVYAVTHSEVFSYAKFFRDKGLENFVFYAGFPEHCKVVIDALVKLIPFSSAEEEPDLDTGIITSMGYAEVQPDHLALALGKNGSWFPEGYEETEVLWTSFSGVCLSGKKVMRTMHCEVPPIPGWEEYGCNVDTGFPAAIIAEMVLAGQIPPGVHSPENAVPPDDFFKQLENLGFSFKITDLEYKEKQ